MRLVCVSDTHEQHEAIALPPGDVLIHAGDLTYKGTPAAIRTFDRWLEGQPYACKIVIAGNHDFAFEHGGADRLITSARYLQDSGTDFEGLTFWGSPWQPRFFDWAFNLDRGPALAAVWARIPEALDVLVVHGPPYGILDQTSHGDAVGCVDLRERLEGMAKPPKLVVFGHIHEAYGSVRHDRTLYVNASICTLRYKPTNRPIVVEIGAGENGIATIVQ